MDFDRIINLIKYDWALYKRNFLLTIAIFSGIFLFFGTISLLWKYFIHMGDSLTFLPVSMLVFASSFASYGGIIMAILVTVLLHDKFTNPRTATAYLTLPGTSFEKMIVLCIDYIVGAITIHAIAYIGIAIFFCIGLLVAPEAQWLDLFKINSGLGLVEAVYASIHGPNDPATFMDALAGIDNTGVQLSAYLMQFIDTAHWLSIFNAIATCLFYMVLNMCFKKNGQLKAIATEIGLGIIAMICFIVYSGFTSYSIYSADTTAPADVVATNVVITILNFMKWALFYLAPAYCAVLLGILYNQISRKQAF